MNDRYEIVCNPEKVEMSERIESCLAQYFYEVINKQRFEELKKDRPQSKSLVDADCDDLH